MLMKQTTLDNILDQKVQTKELALYEPKKVVVFDLIGPAAHFRNIQTNSSSLSYIFPPPTTLFGLLAGIIGKKRDTYYNEFNCFKAFISIEILTKLRKSIHTLNYRFYEEDNYTQIPLEVVFPLNEKELRYRIYFSIDNLEIYNTLHSMLKEGKFYYPPYLGIAEFLGLTQYIGEFKIEKAKKGEIVEISTIFKAKDLEIVEYSEKFTMIPEYMRHYFIDQRIPGPMIKYFFLSSGTVKIKANDAIYTVKLKDQNKIVCRL